MALTEAEWAETVKRLREQASELRERVERQYELTASEWAAWRPMLVIVDADGHKAMTLAVDGSARYDDETGMFSVYGRVTMRLDEPPLYDEETGTYIVSTPDAG